MIVLIDGHNLLFKLKDFSDRDFLKSQQSLQAEVLRWTESQKSRSYILVFDGKGGASEYGYEKKISPCLRLVFSGDKLSADDWIIAYVNNHKTLDIEVVTGDNRLFNQIDSKRVKQIQPESFKASFQKKAIQVKKSKAQIKREFGSTDYWLKEFEEEE